MDKKAMVKKVLAKLKYNIFKSDHPNSALRGKLFKFIGDNKIEFLSTKQQKTMSESDLDKKYYIPADMGA